MAVFSNSFVALCNFIYFENFGQLEKLWNVHRRFFVCSDRTPLDADVLNE